MNPYPIVAFEARVYMGDLDHGRTPPPYFYLHASPAFVEAVRLARLSMLAQRTSFIEVPVTLTAPRPEAASCAMLQRLHLAGTATRTPFILMTDDIPEKEACAEAAISGRDPTLVIEDDGQAILRVFDGRQTHDGTTETHYIVSRLFRLDDLLAQIAPTNALKEAA